ncbi:MAG: GIY-YIG nuclease family protein [Bacteroidaceae bacterium]|nr:GIY-YIG nuclease family protein [Bacteroidaceae bacterium]
MIAQAKTINLLLYDGNLNGVISIEDSSWNAGELYSAPRDSVNDLLETEACKKYGVYMLLSSDTVYVGQSFDLAKRVTQHTVGKDWWESVVILTTKDDSLNHADIDYLESVLIDKAFNLNKLDCDNRKKGNPPKVDKFRKVYLGQYLQEALFLMQLIGITVFSDTGTKPKGKKSSAVPQITTIDVKTKLAIGKRAKAEAIKFVKDSGIELGKDVTYACRQEKKDEYWANPDISLLGKDWYIILNDNVNMVITVLKVPANALQLKSDKANGLSVRKDKTYYIDLNVGVGTLVDRVSKIDLTPYVVTTINY